MNSLTIFSMTILVATTLAAPFAVPPPLLPPGFDELLPSESKQKLMELHLNRDLTFEQRREAIEQVFDELPQEILAKLPLPPGLERLPEEHKQKFRNLQMDRSMTAVDRHNKVKEMVSQLPEELQQVVNPPAGIPPMVRGFPSRPPPGFEAIVGPSVFKQLVKVHESTDLTVPEKKNMIDLIMRQVPRAQLEKLPLPPGFDLLPFEAIQRVRAIFTNFEINWDERHRLVMNFIQQLPREQRRLLRPSPPPFIMELPVEVREQIEDIFDDVALSPPERFHKMRLVFQSLPEEMKARLPPLPDKMPPPPPMMTSL
ncbi:unnamed protein product [Bursaphelenchus xylophilus]|uniref:(pine wood nematode) hypothetical protein n=1 Tax=Bursaphelenchus xylophilus TaxID=6326 RepID=A0A1I7RT50_BURXY|nr:unnamed protein product [Bursaphelenchus xylophilus]CAG9122610.1 unnamed protein product [Bursaphelenchus xylophilus]